VGPVPAPYSPGLMRRGAPEAPFRHRHLLGIEGLSPEDINQFLDLAADPGGVVISSAVFEQARDRVPDSFEDLGDQQVKNIARPVRVYRLAQLSTPVSPTAMSPLPLPDKPSIAVLPFANMSGDPEQEYFADGMVEEIITALSRIRWLFVIARNSTFTYKGQAVDVKQVGRELGVRYVLEGSVRKAGGRVRITRPADRRDKWRAPLGPTGSTEDVFDLQDTVAVSVTGVIEPTLQAAEIRRVADRPTNDPTAYDSGEHAHVNICRNTLTGLLAASGNAASMAGNTRQRRAGSRTGRRRTVRPAPRRRRSQAWGLRNRWFADSFLEETGFEPPVPLATESLPLRIRECRRRRRGDNACYEVLG
jgi:TolB-like protein